MSTELIHLISIKLEYINSLVQCYMNEDMTWSECRE